MRKEAALDDVRIAGGTRKTGLIDLCLGQRLKDRRERLGISQSELGSRLGITFQQIQKYECGRNRIPAARLLLLSEVLDVPISFFFKGLREKLPFSPEGSVPKRHERLPKSPAR
jgi:transcriptional regulator with XRE-family HTH domain